MIFPEIQNIRYSAKLEKSLQNELINCYNKPAKFLPCFVQNIVNRVRYRFKKIKVIIRYSSDFRTDEENQLRSIIGYKKQGKSKKLNTLNCYSAKIPPKKINRLLALDSVASIYLDTKVHALLDTAGVSVKAPLAWNQKITGKNITLAVIDTGIYPHKDLTLPYNRIIAFKDFVKNKKKPYDDNGHGTHVAGDAAGNGYCSNGLYKGPAFESNLVGVKVLDKMGSGDLSNVVAGIEWCIDNKDKYKIKALCMSLGAVAGNSYKEDLLCEAVGSAWKAGIVVCAAAGNEGPGKGTISTPGIDPSIITVGALDDGNTTVRSDDKLANYSSRGPTIDSLVKPDVLCPGTNIISLRSPNSSLSRMMKSSRVSKKYISLSGTSMATPICCGIVALLLQANPILTPDEVKKVITGSSEDLGYDAHFQGSGYIDVEKALNTLKH